MTDPKSEPSELTDEQIDEIILSAPTLGYALLCGAPDQTIRAGEFKKAVRALSRVIAAALTPAPAPWQHLAYAKLGVVRDRMSPSDVVAVQEFLGPLDSAPAPAQPEPADDFERGRQQGMKQERALWELAAIGQEIDRAFYAGEAPHQPEPPTAAGVEPDTLCWLCNKVYAMADEQCPKCGASNANHDFDAAKREEQVIAFAKATTTPALTDAQCDAIEKAVVEHFQKAWVTRDKMAAAIRAAAAGGG